MQPSRAPIRPSSRLRLTVRPVVSPAVRHGVRPVVRQGVRALPRLPLLCLLAALLLGAAAPSRAAEAPGPVSGTVSDTSAGPLAAPRVLLVTAHPDDDALFSGTVYKITHSLGGTVDLALLTNGEGGYRYSTLGEPIYGLQLTDEEVGRAYLPGIRKRELMAGGAIVGIRNYFFLDQVDGGYTRDLEQILASSREGGGWDLDLVRKRLGEILADGDYDFVFTMLPTRDTHAHHQASAVFALEAVAARPEAERPLVLGGSFRRMNVAGDDGSGTSVEAFTGLPEHPLTAIEEGSPVFRFDRMQPFGEGGRLNYQIIANWVIAEHKSQGTMQLLMNRQTEEVYHLYRLNPEGAAAKLDAFFQRLAEAPPHAGAAP